MITKLDFSCRTLKPQGVFITRRVHHRLTHFTGRKTYPVSIKLQIFIILLFGYHFTSVLYVLIQKSTDIFGWYDFYVVFKNLKKNRVLSYVRFPTSGKLKIFGIFSQKWQKYGVDLVERDVCGL